MDEGRLSRMVFIRLLAAALGLGPAASSILGACRGGGEAGRGEEDSESESSTTAQTEEEQRTTGGEPIAEVSEVPLNSAKTFVRAPTRQPGVLVHLEDDSFVAYSAICTHEGCTVAYQPQSQRLACPCHGSVFDPARGAAVDVGPAQMPLRELQIEVSGGEVYFLG